METPLVIQKFTSESDYLPMKSLKDLKFVLWTETVKIWRIAFPMALPALFQFLTISSTSIYAGHLGDIEHSSISVYQGVISAIYFNLLEEWTGFSWMAFRDLWSFAKLSLASSVISCLEQWYGTCIILLAGLLDNPVIDVDSYSICSVAVLGPPKGRGMKGEDLIGLVYCSLHSKQKGMKICKRETSRRKARSSHVGHLIGLTSPQKGEGIANPQFSLSR
ncbi:hypothetical protein JHK86_049679 [Glycine max]|nr:hypothetical protein JHK86_049679 [Glycine max]